MKYFDYVFNLTKFAFGANRLLYLSIAISLFSVAIEVLAMSSMFPLMQSVSGNVPGTDGYVARTLIQLGITVDAGAFLWVFIILFAVRILTQLVGQSLSIFLGRRVMAQLGSRAFEQIIQKLNIREINKESMGFYISLAGNESYRASSLVMSLTQFTSTFALSLLYFLAIVLFSPMTASLILIFALCSLFALYKATKLSYRWGNRQTEESRKAGTVFLDALNNLKAVRAFSAEKYVSNIYSGMIFGYARTLFLVDALALFTKLFPVFLLLLIFSIVLLWSGRSIENSSIAFFVTMIAYLSRFLPTVGQAVTLLMKIASDAKSGKDVTAILNTKLVTEPETSLKLGHVENIELRDVGFSYDEGGEKQILKGVNLKFEQGKSYAVTGKSGIGKSTLVDLLLKFYLPTAGHLYLNDEPISEVTDSEIRNKIILVSQEAAIFDDTVINNICMGLKAPLQEVQLACKSAFINKVIEGMPDGYKTRLQYQGKNLSGGQRQRIAIARALLRQPDVLILDESTSALDKATQEQVIENILREYSEKIVIFVTHDPYIMKRVDQVIDLAHINQRHIK